MEHSVSKQARPPAPARATPAPGPAHSPRPAGGPAAGRRRRFANTVYLRSAHGLQDLPEPGPPEVAFAGRSNAGKSSALNALVQHKRLAFTSKTPGRTQMINFFATPSGALLVDLPGYGFAKVPAKVRDHWGQVVATYLQTRTPLLGLVLIMDARHPLTPLDQQLLDWFAPTGRPVHALLTKSDKLSRREAMAQLADTQARLAHWGPMHTAQLFSSLTGAGVDAAEQALGHWLEIG
jgi:GTP-binding protein